MRSSFLYIYKGWNIISKNSGRKKSKYTGLVNQGCTCYQNATLQQLYLIEEIREGVLNAPLSPLLLRQKRVLINFETYIQSRQPMTYQQLQNYIKSLQVAKKNINTKTNGKVFQSERCSAKCSL